MSELYVARELLDEGRKPITEDELSKRLKKGDWCVVVGDKGVGKTKLAARVRAGWLGPSSKVDLLDERTRRATFPEEFYRSLAVQMEGTAEGFKGQAPEVKKLDWGVREGAETWRDYVASWAKIAAKDQAIPLLVIDSLSAVVSDSGQQITTLQSALFSLKEYLKENETKVGVLVLTRLSLAEIGRLQPKGVTPQSAGVADVEYQLPPFSVEETRQFITGLSGNPVAPEVVAAAWTWCSGYPDDLRAVMAVDIPGLQTAEQVWSSVLTNASSRAAMLLDDEEGSALLGIRVAGGDGGQPGRPVQLAASLRIRGRDETTLAASSTASSEDLVRENKLRLLGLTTRGGSRSRWRNHVVAEQVNQWLLSRTLDGSLDVGDTAKRGAGTTLDAISALAFSQRLVRKRDEELRAAAERAANEKNDAVRVGGRAATLAATSAFGIGAAIVAFVGFFFHRDALTKREEELVQATRDTIQQGTSRGDEADESEATVASDIVAKAAKDQTVVESLQSQAQDKFAEHLKHPNDDEVTREYEKLLQKFKDARRDAQASAEELSKAQAKAKTASWRAAVAREREQSLTGLREKDLATIADLKNRLTSAAKEQQKALDKADNETQTLLENLEKCSADSKDARSQWSACLKSLETCQKQRGGDSSDVEPPVAEVVELLPESTAP